MPLNGYLLLVGKEVHQSFTEPYDDDTLDKVSVDALASFYRHLFVLSSNKD